MLCDINCGLGATQWITARALAISLRSDGLEKAPIGSLFIFWGVVGWLVPRYKLLTSYPGRSHVSV
jgi:hypothetical protein